MAMIAVTTLIGLPARASAASGGSISGTVANDSSTSIEGICVWVDGVGGSTTDANGNYLVENIPVGSYRVRFSDCNPSPIYVTEWYQDAYDYNDGQFVSVTDLMDTPLDPVVLGEGTVITGTVTNTSSAGIDNIGVQLMPVGNTNWVSAQTDANGNYRLGPVQDGQYRLRFEDWNSPKTYAQEYWNDIYLDNDAQVLTLDGSPLSNINATLAQGSTISGNVGDGTGPVGGVCVGAQAGPSNNSTYIMGTQTGGDGNYTLSGLPPIGVRILFNDCIAPYEHLQQWYSGATTYDSANVLNLTPGSNFTGIDATMALGATVSGRVTNAAGDGIPNVNVNLNTPHGPGSGWAQTDSDGYYTSSTLTPGDYRVRFESQDNAYGTEYWDDAATWSGANLLTVGSDNLAGIDVQLGEAVTISGNVTGAGGAAAPNICVAAVYGDDINTLDGTGWAQTDSNGDYTLTKLPAGTYRVLFEDCNNTGPYLSQVYDDATSFDTAVAFNLAPGDARTGVDAAMHPAAVIRGTVTDTDDNPLQYICVQASTADQFGDMQFTDSNGDYVLKLPADGDYVVQFSDCGNEYEGHPGGVYLGQWWGGGLEPSTAQPIAIQAGEVVSDIDAQLTTAGGTGTVNGRVTDVRGEPMTVCIALFMPNSSVRFAMTDANGEYSISDVPTGTYTIGFLGCEGGEPSPYVPDSGGTGVYYQANWVGGAPVSLTGADQAPDPMAQGAGFVTFSPGESMTVNNCFGCERVKVTPTVGKTSVSVNFETLGVMTNTGGPSTVAANLTYSVSCTSPTGDPTSATQDSYPVDLDGFTPGQPYTCLARVLSGGVEVSDSATFNVTVGSAVTPVTPVTPVDPDNGGGGAGGTTTTTTTAPSADAATDRTGDTATPATMAYTGSNTIGMLIAATAMVLIGASVVIVQARKRATS